MFHFVALIYTDISQSQLEDSYFSKIRLKSIAWLACPLLYVLTLPLYQLIFYHFSCLSLSEYYLDNCQAGSILSIFNTVVACVFFLLLSLLITMYSSLLVQPNPFADTPLAAPFRTNVLKCVIIKIFIPICFQMIGGVLKKIMLFVTLVLLFLNEVYVVFSPISYKKNINFFTRISANLLLWANLSMCITFVSLPSNYIDV